MTTLTQVHPHTQFTAASLQSIVTQIKKIKRLQFQMCQTQCASYDRYIMVIATFKSTYSWLLNQAFKEHKYCVNYLVSFQPWRLKFGIIFKEYLFISLKHDVALLLTKIHRCLFTFEEPSHLGNTKPST